MDQAANHNFPAATVGGAFHPEMGERHDGKVLYVAQVSYGGYYLSWSVEPHAEALAAFTGLRVRPRHIDCIETMRGTKKWSCGVTWAAGRKLHDARYSVIEMLLD
jgi:hypothetical protein